MSFVNIFNNMGIFGLVAFFVCGVAYIFAPMLDGNKCGINVYRLIGRGLLYSAVYTLVMSVLCLIAYCIAG